MTKSQVMNFFRRPKIRTKSAPISIYKAKEAAVEKTSAEQ